MRTNTGIKRGKLRLIIISILAGLLTALYMQMLTYASDQTEQTKSRMFWNGYTKLYFEATGSWTGLEERLVKDRFMFAGDDAAALTIYDKDGITAVAQLENRKGNSRDSKKTAVFSDREIVGYTMLSYSTPSFLSLKNVLPPFIATLLVLLLGAGLRRQWLWTSERTEQRIAAEIWRRSALEGEELPSEANRLSSALERVEELAHRVERLETVRRSMVADIAHELRTPIAIMRTQLDHAIQEEQALPMSKIISLHDEILRLTKLVGDLQELSLAESGHLSLSKSWFSFTELAASVAEALAVGTDEQELQLTLELAQDVRLYADESRIRQIMINLVGNALQYARHELRIAVHLKDGEALLVIADDGLGIEEEELPFVFERFYRGGSQKRAGNRSSGLGLGLAIARQFAYVHGGTLSVDSRYGEGAVFSLSLPIIQD